MSNKPMSDDLYDGPCEAGCQHFHGGEVRHHKDCGHYPESLTKLNADRIEKLEAKLAAAVEALSDTLEILADDEGPEVDAARTTLAELKDQ